MCVCMCVQIPVVWHCFAANTDTFVQCVAAPPDAYSTWLQSADVHDTAQICSYTLVSDEQIPAVQKHLARQQY